MRLRSKVNSVVPKWRSYLAKTSCLRESARPPQCLVLNHSNKHTFMNLLLNCFSFIAILLFCLPTLLFVLCVHPPSQLDCLMAFYRLLWPLSHVVNWWEVTGHMRWCPPSVCLGEGSGLGGGMKLSVRELLIGLTTGIHTITATRTLRSPVSPASQPSPPTLHLPDL